MPLDEPSLPAGVPASTHARGPSGSTDREGAGTRGTGVVDFARTGRRLRAALVAVAVLVLGAWAVSALTSGASVRLLAELAGLGLLGSVAIEVVVVGGAAVRGMLAAGERGDRLASADVSLLPPRISGRARR